MIYITNGRILFEIDPDVGFLYSSGSYKGLPEGWKLVESCLRLGNLDYWEQNPFGAIFPLGKRAIELFDRTVKFSFGW